MLEEFSGGLKSGEWRKEGEAVPVDVSVLYWQRQQCTCPQLADNLKKAKSKEAKAEEKDLACCRHGAGCVPFVAVIQEGWQRDFLRTAKQYTSVLLVDATGSTNANRWSLYGAVVPNNAGHAVPAAYLLTSVDSHKEIKHLFTGISRYGALYVPSKVMMDDDDKEMKAAGEAYGTEVDIRICAFHFMQAWDRYMRAKRNEVPEEHIAHITNLLRLLRLSPTVPIFEQREPQLLAYLEQAGCAKLISHYRYV